MSLILVYFILFGLTFVTCGISLMISERYLKDVLIISALNILFFLSVIVYKTTEWLAKRKLRRVFKIRPDEENGRYYYRASYWEAYGGNFKENSTWNTFKNNLKVLFGRKR